MPAGGLGVVASLAAGVSEAVPALAAFLAAALSAASLSSFACCTATRGHT